MKAARRRDTRESRRRTVGVPTVRRLTDDQVVIALHQKIGRAPHAMEAERGAVLSYLGTDPPDGAEMAAESELNHLMSLSVADYLEEDSEFRSLHDEAERRGLDLKDWHLRWFADEPPCGPDQWRTKNRKIVVTIAEMTPTHLLGAIRFAGRTQHSSRLQALKAELNRRYGSLAGQPE